MSTWENLLNKAADAGAGYLTARNEPKKAPVAIAPPPRPQPPYLKYGLIAAGVIAVVAVPFALNRK